MRMGLILAASVAALVADGASAQRMVMTGPGVGPGAGYPAPPPATMGWAGRPPHAPSPYRPASGAYAAPRPGGRWGSKIDGHWWAGVNAPGGWGAYRRPARGWTLPGYWSQPGFTIADWSSYGLGEPPAGYGWTRYYDDALLVDGSGRVYDCVDGVDWDRADSGYAETGGYAGTAYAQPGYPAPGSIQPTYGQSTYAPPPPYPPAPYPAAGYPARPGYAPAPGYVERRNSGVGGALVGAAVGGVAGNLIGGRGNRVAGTLIGAGVGGVAGYAIDRDGHHAVPAAPYGYPREGRGPGPGAAYPPPAYAPPPPVWRSPDGGTTVSTSSVGGYYGGSTTVVTVSTAPVVTTTTTEIVEDHVTYSRRPARRRWVKKAACYCR